ncbi:MAG: diiron oxygenase [Acidimicrobiales bacterium]
MVNSSLDTPERTARDVDAAFVTMVGRLSRLSAGKGFDAYRDVDWDVEGGALDPTDPRFILPEVDPLAATEWYRTRSPEVQARIGLVRMASCLKTGWHFENLLQQGLLHRSLYLRDGSDEFRYVLHEVIEESQHTLMFNEFVNRSGVAVRGMPRWLRQFTELFVPRISLHDPAYFFWMVLGGEDPIDCLQRKMLATGSGHPLLDQIMRIHITEEARHISYARAALRKHVPRVSGPRRQLLSVMVPLTLGIMVRLMVRPTSDVVRAGVPLGVIQDAYRTEAGRALYVECAAKPRVLARELGLMTTLGERTWKAFGIWGPDAT